MGAYEFLAYDGHLPRLGPSYATKLLFFMGYETSTHLRPLILDRRVGASLDMLIRRHGLQPDWIHYGSWHLEDYGRYLRLCERWATAARREPQDIEHALFELSGEPEAQPEPD